MSSLPSQKRTKVRCFKLNNVDVPLKRAMEESGLLNSMLKNCEDQDCDDVPAITLPRIGPLVLNVFVSMVSHPSLSKNHNSAASQLDLPESVQGLNECFHGSDYLDAPRLTHILLDKASLHYCPSMYEPYPFGHVHGPSLKWFKVSYDQYVAFLDALELPDIPKEFEDTNSMAGVFTYFSAIRSLKTLQQTIRQRYIPTMEVNRYGHFDCVFSDFCYTLNSRKIRWEDSTMYAQGYGRSQKTWEATIPGKIDSICFSPSGKHGCAFTKTAVPGVSEATIFETDTGKLAPSLEVRNDVEDTYFINDQFMVQLDGNEVVLIDIHTQNLTFFLDGEIGRPCWKLIVTPNYLCMFVHAQYAQTHKSICAVNLSTLKVAKCIFEFEHPVFIRHLGGDQLLFGFEDTTKGVEKVLQLDTMKILARF